MWQGKWIWDNGAPSPRNGWHCFRQSVRLEQPAPDARLRITADSRYVLYVNGTLVGRGPVRSWPEQLSYDEYEVGHLLRPGADNAIAVLVTHYGISTFQYLRGRGGLLAELLSATDDAQGAAAQPGQDAARRSPRVLASTDEDWRTQVHAGYDAHTSRISCQLGFTERFDARALNDDWTKPGFDDSSWEKARTLGPAGLSPWGMPVPRDIPYLTEEPVRAVRVERLRFTRPIAWAAVVDVRSLFAPESAAHANNIQLVGLLAARIHLAGRGTLTIGSVDDGRLPLRVTVDGVAPPEAAWSGERPERYAAVPLEAGEHLIVLDVSGQTHGHGYHIAFDSDVPLRVRALDDESDSAFTAIGPFDTVEVIDHQQTRELRRGHPAYARAAAAASVEELTALSDWLAPVPPALVNLEDTFTHAVWTSEARELPVPHELQLALAAGPDGAALPLEPGADTELIVDFGRELTGYLAFEIEAEAGTTLDLYGFEYMRRGWLQHTYQLDNTMRYVTAEGRQRYVSPIRRGLRYVQIAVRGAQRPLRLYDLQLRLSTYPVAELGRFQSSDALLERIWHISRETTRMCMEDTFVDCPAFEQVFWVGDARNEALVSYYAFGSSPIVERCLRLVPGSAFQSPLYADQVPSGWNSVIPNWTLFWVTACREYYDYTGSLAFARDIWPQMRAALEAFLGRLQPDGLFVHQGWNLLEWGNFEQPRDGIVTPQNMFLVKALRDAAYVAEAVQDQEDAARYVAEADKLRECVDRLLWDESRQAYVDCIRPDGSLSQTISMQAQVVALLCDIPQGERAARLARYLEQPPAAFVQIGSPFMSFFLHEAMARLGRYDLLADDIRRSYGVMVEHDATTCWEVFIGSSISPEQRADGLEEAQLPELVRDGHPSPPTRSHCHAWSAGPAYFLGAYALGVRGLTPGWTRVAVQPQLCGLTRARGAVPLPGGGCIDVEWQADLATGRFYLRVEAPQGVELDIAAPDDLELVLRELRIGY
ncbi:family 78 glycoside hydrolase catalytic domain [Paenibacillus sp. IB182496]|uniref:Family 78 glycoside hydrolase catalytic domain n=1 Tax=Paenibacillus sabuli TaxID=2772509 RepID=A0A927GT87_9BACL|nr:family 78 glycoside hydrolase catalytic domain [Paenibacillus sabuli]MBD2846840.1 family 78 glycoside hydrolase catalytic domain [Paenibacillus sabuli]